MADVPLIQFIRPTYSRAALAEVHSCHPRWMMVSDQPEQEHVCWVHMPVLELVYLPRLAVAAIDSNKNVSVSDEHSPMAGSSLKLYVTLSMERRITSFSKCCFACLSLRPPK
jgi:hypothetical protein